MGWALGRRQLCRLGQHVLRYHPRVDHVLVRHSHVRRRHMRLLLGRRLGTLRAVDAALGILPVLSQSLFQWQPATRALE